MKIIAIMGSPRKHGNTFKIVRMIEESIGKIGGIDFEYLYLRDYNIESCTGCLSCFSKGEQACQVNDDINLLKEKLDNADAAIFASPTYVVNVSGIMKNFIDRLAYICHRPAFYQKYAVLVADAAAIGDKQTLEGLRWPATSWGYKVLHEIGLIMNEVELSKISKKKMRKLKRDTKTAAEKLYNAISSIKPPSPSVIDLVAFEMRKKSFGAIKDPENYDYKYWKEKGWLNSCYFYDVKINPVNKAIASVLVKLLS